MDEYGGEFYHGNDIRSSPAGICSSLLLEGEASTGFKKDDPFYGFYIFSIDVWHGVGRKWIDPDYGYGKVGALCSYFAITVRLGSFFPDMRAL